MDTFTPGVPSVDSGGSSETPRTLHVQYGGDAKNDIADGINTTPIGFSGIWDVPRPLSDGIIGFLDLEVGRSFLWTMPRETAPRIWQATRWTRTIVSYDHHRIEITLEEQYRP